MRRLHVFRNLRTAAFLLAVCGILTAMGVLWWANHTGLPETWRAKIEQEAAKQGAHIQVGALSYIPLKGVVASDVRVFSDPERLHELSRLEQIVLDLDKTKLARGIFRLRKIELSDARVSLPVDPLDPNSSTLEISGARGTVLMPGGRLLEIRNARGKVGGINIVLSARVLGFHKDGGDPKDDPNEGARRAMLARVVKELEKWKFSEDRPPTLRIFAEGDLSDRGTVTARMDLQAYAIEKNGHVLDEVNAKGSLIGNLLTVSELHASDSRGEFNGRIDYDLKTGEGRFDVKSGLEVPELLKSWLGLPPIKEISFGGDQSLEAEGEFKIEKDQKPQIRMTGHARCESVMLRGLPFDAVEGAFSWKDGDLYLRDLLLERKDGRATGKALIQWPIVRMALTTTLPVRIYTPFFKNQPLEKVLLDFSEREGADLEVKLEGGFDATDKASWAYAGSGKIHKMSFRGVPVESAECKFSLSRRELDFFDGTLVFDYTDYPLRKAFDGNRRGTAKVGRIRYDGSKKLVEVENVQGEIWVAPLVRLFAAKIADGLEVYRFHQPPMMKGSGIVDVTPQGRTSLDISFQSEHPADYVFLGENLTLNAPTGRVSLRGSDVKVEPLKFEVFSGPVGAKFHYHQGGKLDGELTWTKLALGELASTFDFQIKGKGAATGRIDFSMQSGKVETMNGEGLLALEKAELFSVPMFGPLSPLISTVLGDKRAGFERAKDAFLSFKIREGILNSSDFRTTTSSLVLTGDGNIDLLNKHIDMTVRMNARGLLGLITLPLRPFYGLFQFRGTGPLKKPEWESVMFTSPPESQNEILLDPPKARVILEN